MVVARNSIGEHDNQKRYPLCCTTYIILKYYNNTFLVSKHFRRQCERECGRSHGMYETIVKGRHEEIDINCIHYYLFYSVHACVT